MTALLSLIIADALCIAVLAWQAWTAPAGFEDTQGYHEGSPE